MLKWTYPMIVLKHEADYNPINVKLDIKDLDKESWVEISKASPQAIHINNVKTLSEKHMTLLSWAHLEYDIKINEHMFKSICLPRYKYEFVEIDGSIPAKLANIMLYYHTDKEPVPQHRTLLETLNTYTGYMPNNIYEEVKRGFTVYATYIAGEVKKKNYLTFEQQRLVEDFYLNVAHTGITNRIHELAYYNCEAYITDDPEYKCYSPSAKTSIELAYKLDYDNDIRDIQVDLIAPEDQITAEMRQYWLTTPNIMVMRDSKEAWKTTYVPKDYSDRPLGTEAAIEGAKEAKFQGYTRILEEVIYYPDASTLIKKYYNDTKERNIPNAIREELINTPVRPNNWLNFNHEYAIWVQSLPDELQKDFENPDLAECPVCHETYNINAGCIDPETGEIHVYPHEELTDTLASVLEYYDTKDGCFCERVELFLKSLK